MLGLAVGATGAGRPAICSGGRCISGRDHQTATERAELFWWLSEATKQLAAFGERLHCGQCRHQWPGGEWAILLCRKEGQPLLFVIPLLRTGRVSDEGRFREVPPSAHADGLTLGASEEIPLRVSLRTCPRLTQSTSVPAGQVCRANPLRPWARTAPRRSEL